MLNVCLTQTYHYHLVKGQKNSGENKSFKRNKIIFLLRHLLPSPRGADIKGGQPNISNGAGFRDEVQFTSWPKVIFVHIEKEQIWDDKPSSKGRLK